MLKSTLYSVSGITTEPFVCVFDHVREKAGCKITGYGRFKNTYLGSRGVVFSIYVAKGADQPSGDRAAELRLLFSHMLNSLKQVLS